MKEKSSVTFTKLHEEWLKKHLRKRSGDRRSRLEQGHHHAEILFLKNVWFPIFGHFDHLHPEFEVRDWRHRSYFADFAWLAADARLIIEIKGYNAHVRDADRKKFSDELNRETYLISLGFRIISFSYDDVEKNPEQSIYLLKSVLSLFTPYSFQENRPLTLYESDIIRYAMYHNRPIRPVDIERKLNIGHRKSKSLISSLVDKGYLIPQETNTNRRTCFYHLNRT